MCLAKMIQQTGERFTRRAEIGEFSIFMVNESSCFSSSVINSMSYRHSNAGKLHQFIDFGAILMTRKTNLNRSLLASKSNFQVESSISPPLFQHATMKTVFIDYRYHRRPKNRISGNVAHNGNIGKERKS
jgi:hypothetical protein